MEDPLYLKYVEYFKRQPMTQQYYYRIGTKKSATATELSKQMHRSIQTVTNVLRDLEKVGLLNSEKKGRVRTYTLKDPRLFKGLSSVYYFSRRGIKEDIISRSTFSQNMEKWLRYVAQILEGTLYVDQTFHVHILGSIKVDFVIENKNGQHLIMFISIDNKEEVESTVGRIFSLLHSKDINPNLTTIFAVCLIKEDNSQTAEKLSALSDLSNQVSSALGQISDPAKEFIVCIAYFVESVKSDDLAKDGFSESLTAKINEGMPYFSSEELPGEIWEFGDIASRRRRAFDSIQNKLKPKIRLIFPTLRELLPRDSELKRVLYPESLLLSLGLKEGDTFVDESCFEGLFTIPASKIVGENGKVYGIEFSSIALAKLKTSLSQNNIINVALNNDFPEAVIIASNFADFAFFGTALYDMYNPLKALKNAYTMLKDSGKLVVLEWKSHDPDEKPSRHPKTDVGAGPNMQARLNKELVIQFVKEAGFEIERIKDEGFYLYLIIATKSKITESSKDLENKKPRKSLILDDTPLFGKRIVR